MKGPPTTEERARAETDSRTYLCGTELAEGRVWGCSGGPCAAQAALPRSPLAAGEAGPRSITSSVLVGTGGSALPSPLASSQGHRVLRRGFGPGKLIIIQKKKNHFQHINRTKEYITVRGIKLRAKRSIHPCALPSGWASLPRAPCPSALLSQGGVWAGSASPALGTNPALPKTAHQLLHQIISAGAMKQATWKKLFLRGKSAPGKATAIHIFQTLQKKCMPGGFQTLHANCLL